ncbi:MAG: peptidase M10A and M12B matrixin and adamalysin [Candidatus Methylumidiphilus sp.]
MPKLSYLSATLMLLAASHGAQAVTVQFDYSLDSSNFFTNNANSKSALEAAGQFFATNISDALSAITSSGSNHFNAIFDNPSTGQEVTLNDYSVAADTLVVFVGASALPGGTLGEGGPGGFTASSPSQAFLDSIGNRGQVGATTGAAATEFAPWGGKLSFSSTASWYFDADPSTLESFAGQNDFYSVALHELSHLFGFGTAASWTAKVSGGSFTGANASAANGGSVALAGDNAHWLDGTQSVYAGSPQEAAMDPSLTQGTRKNLTTLDLAALKDIGWQVATPAPVPVPAAGWLFASALLGVFRLRRKSV